MSTEDSIIYSYFWIEPNLPPICEDFYTTLLKGKKWEITAFNCQDSESSWITYQYYLGFSKTEYYWASVPLLTNIISINAPDGIVYIGVLVCDDDNSCTDYVYNINTRRISDLIDEFQESIYEADMIPSSIVYYAQSNTTYEEFLYILEAFFEYYASEPISKASVKAYISNLNILAAYENYMNSVNISAIANLTISILEDYTESLDYEDGALLLGVLENLKNDFSRDNLLYMIDLIGLRCLGNGLLGTSVYYENIITVYRTRQSPSQLLNSTISLNNSQITFPDDFDFDENSVYDLAFSRYDSSSNIFELTIYYVGTYSSYTLILQDPQIANISMNSGLQVKIYGNFHSDIKYKCELLLDNWYENGECEIIKSNGDYAIVMLYHLSVFRIIEDDNLCETGRGPIATISLLSFIMIIFGTVFFLTDNKVFSFTSQATFLKICPLTSIFLPQNSPRRTAMILQLLTSEMLLLTLIGALMYYFDSPEDRTSYVFDKYYGFQLSRGAIAWALCQVYTVPIFFLNSLVLKYTKFKLTYILTIVISIVIACGCMAGVIIMTVKYCGGWTELWIVNFLIFTLFDWATLEIIYSVVAWLLLRERGSDIEEPKSGKSGGGRYDSRNPTENDTERNRRAVSDEENDSGEYGPIIINE